MITENEYELLNLKRMKLEEDELNYKLYKLDNQLVYLDEKYKNLQDDERFKLVQKFQNTLIDLETIEMEIKYLQQKLGIPDEIESEDSQTEDSQTEDSQTETISPLNVVNDILNKFQPGELNEF